MVSQITTSEKRFLKNGQEYGHSKVIQYINRICQKNAEILHLPFPRKSIGIVAFLCFVWVQCISDIVGHMTPNPVFTDKLRKQSMK